MEKTINVEEEKANCINCGKELDKEDYVFMGYCENCYDEANISMEYCENCYNEADRSMEYFEDKNNSILDGKTEKSWLSTLLLCIFAGILGFHNFYVGKIVKGLLYFFTLGFFGIGTFIDLVMIITENFTDTYGNKITREKSNHNDNSSISTAEEIKKYKDLLDNGIITQEEFEMKKKKLLNL